MRQPVAGITQSLGVATLGAQREQPSEPASLASIAASSWSETVKDAPQGQQPSARSGHTPAYGLRQADAASDGRKLPWPGAAPMPGRDG